MTGEWIKVNNGWLRKSEIISVQPISRTEGVETSRLLTNKYDFYSDSTVEEVMKELDGRRSFAGD